MAASGVMSLVDNSINMKVMTVLNKAYSQQVGGSQVGGYMSTALANSQGELVLPAIVTGTLQNPKVSPDTQAIAQMKLQNLVPTLSNPAVLGSIFGKGGNGQQGQQGNALGQVLGALQGKQPKQAQPANNNQQQQQQAQPQQQQGDNVNDAISGALGGLFGNKKKKQDQKQQQQQQQQQNPPQ
jgi:hypothetical protein